MKIVVFCESIQSDINYNSIHFLRGIVSELQARNHQVTVAELEGSSSVQTVIKEFGKTGINEFKRYYGSIEPKFFKYSDRDNITKLVSGANLVIVHHSIEKDLLEDFLSIKKKEGFKLMYLDASNEILENPALIKKSPIARVDAVLATGKAIYNAYVEHGVLPNIINWQQGVHQAVVHPRATSEILGDLVWVQNFPLLEEQIGVLEEYFIQPVKDLRIKAKVFGAGFSKQTKKLLADASIEYGGFLPSFKMPEVYAKYKATIYLPQLNPVSATSNVQPGILFPLACSIPLISAPLPIKDEVFTPGREYLLAKNGYEMKHFILEMMNSTLKEVIIGHGLKAITKKHTVAHRINELEQVLANIGMENHEIFPKKHSLV